MHGRHSDQCYRYSAEHSFSLAVKGFAVCQLRAELSSKSWPFLYWYSRIVWRVFSATVSSALAPHSAAPTPRGKSRSLGRNDGERAPREKAPADGSRGGVPEGAYALTPVVTFPIVHDCGVTPAGGLLARLFDLQSPS